MNNPKVTPLWEQNVEFPQLRKPFTPSQESEKPSETNNKTSPTDLAKKSTLSALAKEFYPASFKYTQNTASTPPVKSIQDRLKVYKQKENDNQACYNNTDYEYVNECIELLTMKPGKFDSIVPQLVEYLEPYYNDVESISKITGVIFNQALTQQNFTYTGARLCAMLDQQCPLLRGCLHQLCEKELETTSNLPALTLFFAEIYTQMNFELFGKCLLKALKQLLDTPMPDNVKYACQTLKLSGAKLDKLDNEHISKIIKQLESLSPTLPSSIANLVQSVINLRNKQWGMTDTSSSSLPPPAEPVEWSDGPVFYGPDGQQLTTEESEFLSESLNELILDDPDGLWNPEPEMNEEIQAAFAEFLKMSNR